MTEVLPIKIDAAEPYFVFALSGYFYAIPASIIQEVVYLPEMTLLATASADVVGVFALRGKLIPVLDVRFRFQQTARPYQTSDCVIIMQLDGQTFGLIVNDVYDVCIADSVDDNPLLFSSSINSELVKSLLIGSLTYGDRVITLLNMSALVAQALYTPKMSQAEHRDFYSLANDEDRAVFALRAEQLKWQENHEDASDFQAIAVVVLNDEYFGIDLLSVREFTHIGNIVPIPCTPEHILGCINLRGNVITLMDMRRAINLPQIPPQADSKVVVIKTPDEYTVAIVVDNVKEVIYINPQKITPVPTTPASVSGDYLTGEMHYQDKLLTLIDLNLILEKGELVVEEEV